MKSKVISVPKSKPPMMVTAILPNIASVSNGIIPNTVVSDAIMTGRKRL